MTETPNRVTVTIDGEQIQMAPGTMIIQAGEQLGIEIPHYCYHPGLPIEGVCRMCLVEVEKSPKLMIACATPVTEGMVVHTRTPHVEETRRGILEFYLLNHPLDCPICDKGGGMSPSGLHDAFRPRDESVRRGKDPSR